MSNLFNWCTMKNSGVWSINKPECSEFIKLLIIIVTQDTFLRQTEKRADASRHYFISSSCTFYSILTYYPSTTTKTGKRIELFCSLTLQPLAFLSSFHLLHVMGQEEQVKLKLHLKQQRHILSVSFGYDESERCEGDGR